MTAPHSTPDRIAPRTLARLASAWLALALLSLTPLAVASPKSPADDHAAAGRATISATIAGNQFVTYRRTTTHENIGGYDHWLGGRFLGEVSEWHEGMVVVDGGAGTAGLFADIAENARLGRRPPYQPRSVPKMYAVSMARPRAVSTQPWQGGGYAAEGTRQLAIAVERMDTMLDEPGSRAKYVEGSLGGPNYAVERSIGFGKVDRVVDVYGASAYAEGFDRVLRGYGRMLRAGGRMHLSFDVDHTSFTSHDGRPIAPREFFASLGGLRVMQIESPQWNRPQYLAVTLERTSEPLEVPELAVETYRVDPGWTAPTRRYRVAPPRAARPAIRARTTSATVRRPGALGGRAASPRPNAASARGARTPLRH